MNEKRVFQPKPNLETYKSFVSYWKSQKVYQQISRRNAQPFVLHDGPPYANGNIHIGHAVNKILKDCANRIQAMLGKAIDFVLGWDCSGLPIEAKVEEELNAQGLKRKEVEVGFFLDKCRAFANKWIEVQAEEFDALGVCSGDARYTTIEIENQVAIVDAIQQFAKNNLIYTKLRPIWWSCEEETALADAEIEYKEKESNTVYCLMKIQNTKIPLLQNNGNILIWTTTPWSLPSNQAIAYNRDFIYKIIDLEGKRTLIATNLLGDFTKMLNSDDLKILGEVKGEDLEGTTYLYPFNPDKIYSLYHSDHVTDKQGTGFVHIAPDHGLDDFYLGENYGLKCLDYIDSTGHFRNEIPEELSFLRNKFYAASDKLVIEHLGDSILMKNKILHQYPTSWRSRKPVIFRSTNQWFIDIKNLKNLGIEEALKVKWYPANSRERFISTLERRESWCISRQRMWGTPICLFHQNGKILLDQNVLAKTLDYLRNNGIQSWWSDDAARIILGDQWQNYEKVKDIVDVWLESGSTQYFVLKKRNKHPADLYLEGSDQHRAWFQSSMMVSLVTSGCAPYKKVKTHGYVVDVNGRKMSKSLGNGKSPQEILKEHGPDVLRLWVLGQNTSMDVVFSENQLLSCKKIEHKVRNTLKFMIQNGKKHDIEYNSLPLLEKHLLNRIYQIQDLFVEVSETLEFHELMHELYLFCENDLSKLYFDIRKDALYWENNLLKKQVENCLHIGFQYLVRWIAPYMPFAAEDAWQTWLEHNEMDCSSIHITSLPEVDPQWKNASDAKKMDMIFDLRDRVNVEVERLREKGTVKAAIDCHIDLYLPKEDNKAANCKDLAGELELIRQVCIISSLNIHESISASPATGSKCSKCKRWWAETMQNLCARCYKLFGAQDLGD